MGKGLAQQILAAAGAKKASLVLKHGKVVNVFTAQLEDGDVAIEDGVIVGVGSYEGEVEVELNGAVVCPAFTDGHIHLESSMVSPEEFERCVVPHGTLAVVTDPHEIANVAGTEGIQFMMDRTEGLKLDVYFMLPSCVPATGLDESGAVLKAEQLEPFYGKDRVLGLAELMNSYGTVRACQDILDKIEGAANHGGLIDGHAPGLAGNAVNAYVTAGVRSDHECSDENEAFEKMKRGQWIMIREGTAARNLEALLPLFEEPYYHRCMLVTDDKHPGDLLRLGHIDYIIRKAVSHGADPVHAVIMGTYNAAVYFGLKGRGAVAPGYKADLVAVSDLKEFRVEKVWKDGRLVAENGKLAMPGVGTAGQDGAGIRHLEWKLPDSVGNSFHMAEVTAAQLVLPQKGERIRVLCLTPGELITTEQIVPWTEREGYAPGVDPDQDIVKMAVFERHHNTGHVGIGFLGGYGLKRGAVATSIAHDSHNLITAGTNDGDMALAANTVRANKGGLAVVADGKVLGALALPIGGLMSEAALEEVDETLERLKGYAAQLGVKDSIDPFMTLGFASLPVIPKLRLNTYGLIDVDTQQVISPVL